MQIDFSYNGEKRKEEYIRRIISLLISAISIFFVSRVTLIREVAPFGIALLLILVQHLKEGEIVVVSIMSILGYATVGDKIGPIILYITYVVTIGIIALILSKKKIQLQICIQYMVIFFISYAYKIVFNDVNYGMGLFLTFVEMIAIIPIYYIFKFSISSMASIRTNYLFNSEEIASMALLISVIVAGFWGIDILGVNIANVLGITIIIMASLVCGNGMGIIFSIAIGVMVGINSEGLMIIVGTYALVSMTIEIIRESGKVLAIAGGIIAFIIIYISGNTSSYIGIWDGAIAFLIALIIPKSVYNSLEREFNFEVKREKAYESYGDKIKSAVNQRMSTYSNVLDDISNILKQLTISAEKNYKDMGEESVYNLVEKVCSRCSMKNQCWEKETYYTYAAFEELIDNILYNNEDMPEELNRKCINRTMIKKISSELKTSLMIRDIYQKKQIEGREILSNNISHMANSIEEIINEFQNDISFDVREERNIAYAFNKAGIEYKDLSCINTKDGRLVVNVKLNYCRGTDFCVSNIIPIISRAVKREMCVGNENCCIDRNKNLCTVSFEERPQFYISSCVKVIPKEGEIESGDNSYFGKGRNGEYNIFLSDGMGSGKVAGQDSSIVIDLVKKLTESGLSMDTVIDTLNSIMSLKFNEEEKFATLDIANIDLYRGELELIKVGAAATFIKRGEEVKVIDNTTLPIGVLDKPDIQINNMSLDNGDIIVMLSDGVIDCQKGDEGDYSWLEKYLKNCKTNSQELIRDGIIKEAMKLSKGHIKDDMTLIVSKTFKVMD